MTSKYNKETTKISCENRFFVYVYLDPRKPGVYSYSNLKFGAEPFYVGKGQYRRWRPTVHAKKYQLHLVNKVNKIGKENVIIQVVAQNLTEQDAFQLEKELIVTCGRLDLGKGPLINKTNGGEGNAGGKRTAATREKISKALKKYYQTHEPSRAWQGKTRDKETRQKISEKLKGRKATAETCLKRSKSLKGKNVGKIRTEETKQKHREIARRPDVIEKKRRGMLAYWRKRKEEAT